MFDIIDNFLPEEDFNSILESLQDNNIIKWEFVPQLNPNAKDEHGFQFTHNYYNDLHYYKEQYNNSHKIPMMILKRYTDMKRKKYTLSRARVNLFINTSRKNKPMGFHKDIEKDFKLEKDAFFGTLLLYLEDSDGYTEMKTGEKIESKRNRLFAFNAELEHQTVSHTSCLFRRNININFKELNG
jgi:hypothetical protein